MPQQNVPTTTEQAPASSEAASKPSLGRVIAAWAVHAFTISGLAWARSRSSRCSTTIFR